SDRHRAFIAVHTGAGRYSRRNERAYTDFCRRVCQTVGDRLAAGAGALEAVSLAVAMLEDSELTNAGRGSCLSRDGSVQCDAGVMLDSRGLFAGVGALPGLVRRPVLVARCLLESQLQSPLLPGGLIPPSLLVGHGALDWARANCRDCDVGFVESDNALVTPAARTAYLKYSRLLEAAEQQQQQQRLGPRKRRAESPDSSPSGSQRRLRRRWSVSLATAGTAAG
ncbi:hypothetical protein BOX15_Mlig014387g2, partial [Macrostomum lignano]